MSATTKVIDSLADCQRVVKDLERQQFIAVDSEGVHLSKTGPLTLLQVGVPSDPVTVYLFDVMREPRMFEAGGLKSLLQNNAVVKVLHSAKNDATALYHQFGVEIRNVHDTQVAHMEMRRAEGDELPRRRRLAEVCNIYCPEKAAPLAKDTVKTKFTKEDGEYWARRPLTQEMKDYAAYDVIALIPEVYTKQKQMLAQKGLTQVFQTRVGRELKSVSDLQVHEALLKEEKKVVQSMLKRFSERTSGSVRFQDIEDEHIQRALDMVRLNEIQDMGLPQFIRRLKLQQISDKIDKMEQELREKGKEKYDPNEACRPLWAIEQALEESPLKERVKRLLEEMKNIVLEDIKRKYRSTTPAKHLTVFEQKVLSRDLRPQGPRDPSIHPVLLKLHWEVKLEDLQEKYATFRKNPPDYKVSDGYVKLLRYFVSGDVPLVLKQTAKEFLDALEGCGKVSRPMSRAGGLQYRGGASPYF